MSGITPSYTVMFALNGLVFPGVWCLYRRSRRSTEAGLVSRKPVDRSGRPQPPESLVSSVLAISGMREALAGDRKIEAIRPYRRATNTGLRDAKEVIDAVMASTRQRPQAGVLVDRGRFLPPVRESGKASH